MFSLNIIADLMEMFQYPFMRHAFEAGTIVAIVAGIVGYFVILRQSSFAAHALSHIGFAGAAGAVLVGQILFFQGIIAHATDISPVYGLLIFTCIAGVAIAILGPRAYSRDVHIGTVLAFMLGLGVLFISQYSGYASEAYAILFGEILAISYSDVILTIEASIVILLAIAILYRPLLFSSIDEDVAEAKGLPVLFLGIAFMLLVAGATSIAVQVVGVLLIFSLMVTPAATAQRLTTRPRRVIMISVIIAVIATWLGLFIAYYEPYPVSFFITSIVFIFYLFVRFAYPRLKSKSYIASLDHSHEHY